ncbi:hypothetical protein ABMA27_010290 [Loxostege sticticalis]|uniref:Uncharacterized protein n=1 Tax=Loxostege sticticalis TaxID=481309 RepID=A0ABR3H5A0_LOXSC
MSVGQMREFDVRSGNWSSYVDRLEMYFIVNKVVDEFKLPTLISVMGEEAYDNSFLVSMDLPHIWGKYYVSRVGSYFKRMPTISNLPCRSPNKPKLHN